MFHKKITILALLVGLTASPSLSLAQSHDFFVDPTHDIAGRTSVSATLNHTSEKAYFYVEDNFYNSLSSSKRSELFSKLNSLGTEFDTRIYPALRSAYGSEWSPGIDNDPRVTIFITRLRAETGGYVLFSNEQSKAVNPNSNEREMIYLNTDIIFEDEAKAHLAHEFVHLIEYNQRVRQRGVQEPTWLSEGLADYAPTLLGYNNPYAGSHLQSRVQDFLTSPHDSLLVWNGRSVDFATTSLFMHYLTAHYGNSVLFNIMQSSSRGDDAVTEALSRLNYTDTFEDVFTRWTVANYLNGVDKDGSNQYSYRSSLLSYSNLRISSPVQYSIFPGSSISSNFFVNYGSASWLKFVPGQLGDNDSNILNIKFSSATAGAFSAPYIVTDIFGKSEVRFIPLNNGAGTAQIQGFGTDILSVVLVPSNYYKAADPNPPSSSFTINISLNEGDVQGDNGYAEGSLLRAQGDPKVYVIKNGTKRWIPSAQIFNGYGHLKWENIITVDPSVLAQYETSSLIKFIGDYRVYEVSANGTIKQWLNITPQQFDASARRWDAIYEVNENEFNAYATGTAITL